MEVGSLERVACGALEHPWSSTLGSAQVCRQIAHYEGTDLTCDAEVLHSRGNRALRCCWHCDQKKQKSSFMTGCMMQGFASEKLALIRQSIHCAIVGDDFFDLCTNRGGTIDVERSSEFVEL